MPDLHHLHAECSRVLAMDPADPSREAAALHLVQQVRDLLGALKAPASDPLDRKRAGKVVCPDCGRLSQTRIDSHGRRVMYGHYPVGTDWSRRNTCPSMLVEVGSPEWERMAKRGNHA